MTLRFGKKEIYTLLLAIIVTVGLVFTLYFLYLNPKKLDVETQRNELKSNKQLLATLQEKEVNNEPLTAESIAALQRKVPVKQQLEQLILDLEQAEVVSKSLITNLTITEGDFVVEPKQEDQATEDQQQNNENAQEPNNQNTENNADTNSKNANNENQSDDNSQENQENSGEKLELPDVAPTPLPTGIKKISISLNVESKTYEELKKFLDSIENLPRILVVENVAFSGPKEVSSVSTEKDKKLTYTVTLSAYYMPTLTDLRDKLPELVAPQPGNKTNPFYQSPDL